MNYDRHAVLTKECSRCSSYMWYFSSDEPPAMCSDCVLEELVGLAEREKNGLLEEL